MQQTSGYGPRPRYWGSLVTGNAENLSCPVIYENLAKVTEAWHINQDSPEMREREKGIYIWKNQELTHAVRRLRTPNACSQVAGHSGEHICNSTLKARSSGPKNTFFQFKSEGRKWVMSQLSQSSKRSSLFFGFFVLFRSLWLDEAYQH